MRKALVLAYAAAAYSTFVGVLTYAVLFVENMVIPRTVDGPSSAPTWRALAVDALLLGAFAVQHSVMARPAFKRWWTRLVPRALERSTYVVLSSLVLAAACWWWEPVTAVVWRVEAGAAAALLRGASLCGWLLALASTFLTSHVDLFGLRQAWLHARGRPYVATGFTTRLLYRVVRHPLMLGFVIAFWATPLMTVGHLAFALLTTAYILVGIRLEERDLVAELGPRYEAYRREVPMLVPRPPRSHARSASHVAQPRRATKSAG